MKYTNSLVASFSFAASSVLADTVTIGTSRVYDAGTYTIEPAALQGFEMALTKELCKRAGFTCELNFLPPDQLWSALKTGEIDAVMAGVSVDEDLGDSFDRTMPFLTPDPYLHIGLPDTEWTNAAAIVSHLPDPAVAAYARTSGASFFEYKNHEEALGAIRRGEVLSLFGEREALAPLVEESGGELAIVGDKDEFKIKPGVAMVLRADNIDLRFAFEDQIFEMSQDESLNALTEVWFGLDAARW